MSILEMLIAIAFGVPIVSLCAMIVCFALMMKKREVKTNV